jgi:integrase
MNFFENTSLNDTSIKLYNTKINEWINFMPQFYQSIICIIMFPDVAMKALETNLKSNTNTNRHIYIVGILSFIKHRKHLLVHLSNEEYSTIRLKWININVENEAPIIQRRLENKPTDKQLKKGGSAIPFSEIVERRDCLPIGSIERLLVSMYTMIPPTRGDYFATQIVREGEVPKEKNYIRISGGGDKMECTITDFKTSKTYKKIHNVFPPELVAEVNASLTFMPRSYLFTNSKGEPFTRSHYTIWAGRVLTRLFETEFTLVFFRHAFITDFITNRITPDTTDADIKAVSDRMGHSPEMFRAYKWIKSGGDVESAEAAIGDDD